MPPTRTQACACSTSVTRTDPAGALVPPKPARMVDHCLIQSADVCVDSAGLIYSTDYNGGLYIIELGA